MNAVGAITAIPAASAPSGPGSVSGIGGTGSVDGASPIRGTVDGTDATGQAGNSFLQSLGEAFGSLNGQLTAADASMAGFAAGGSADLHTVMLQMQEASISLKAAVDVRDKLLEAYQEIMRTQL